MGGADEKSRNPQEYRPRSPLSYAPAVHNLSGKGRPMPNPPKPNEIKRRLGNPGKRALPAASQVILLPAALEIPDPPRPLGVEGMKLWQRIWDAGRSWISPASDLEHVALLCESMDERTALRYTVLSGGDWRDRVALRQLDSQLTSMLSALAFNPVDRSRLGFAEVATRSKLEELRARSNRG